MKKEAILEVTDNGQLTQRGDKRAYTNDGPWCFATANPPKMFLYFSSRIYIRGMEIPGMKKSRKQRKVVAQHQI